MNERTQLAGDEFKAMYCRKCRYRLMGLQEHRCPECGKPFDPNDPATFLRRRRRRIVTQAQRRLLIAMLIALPFEALAIALSYVTLGNHSYYDGIVLATVLNGAALYAIIRHRYRRARILILVAAAVIVPRQLYVGPKCLLLRYEAGRIIDYIESVKIATGDYPADLAGYDSWIFRHTDLLAYSPIDEKCGCCVYWETSPGMTLHWYSAGHEWHYIPHQTPRTGVFSRQPRGWLKP